MQNKSPYVGPKPFEREDQNKFFGRDREADILHEEPSRVEGPYEPYHRILEYRERHLPEEQNDAESDRGSYQEPQPEEEHIVADVTKAPLGPGERCAPQQAGNDCQQNRVASLAGCHPPGKCDEVLEAYFGSSLGRST